MTPTQTSIIAQVHQLLAANGYEVSELGADVLRVRDLTTSVSFQVALEGNVLFMTVALTTVPEAAVTPEIMRQMLAADNGITTSSFQLYSATEGKVAVTLNNFCTLQNMGPEDCDDIQSCAGYLLADLVEAREMLEPKLGTGEAAGA
ncbi:MAG: hypothetical protein SGI92_05770 [Bryobacteraceae bacterium]|nr:hypothetical protein [Bryobacteraceae bacterium]